MTNPTTQQLRVQTIRESILRNVNRTNLALPGVVVAPRHLYEGFTNCQVPIPREDVNVELAWLVGERLLATGKLVGGGVGYVITNRGRNFVDAEFPWDKLDEFA